ncbi:MAG: tryptophanase [Candidatus Krumholzibacteriota bacterium]|nr:tryptophanase [Candidatus Krumholzibacteriota bacterium]
MSDAVDFFISKFRKNIQKQEKWGRCYRPRPYRNAVVRFRNCSIDDFEERRDILINEAGLNAFLFRADKIPGCDLLSDSGTTTMTMEQWASLFMGDEAYGSNEGYFELKRQVEETFGPGWGDVDTSVGGASDSLFIFHQGRAAENAFFSVLSRKLREEGSSYPPEISNKLGPELKNRIKSKITTLSERFGSLREPICIIPSNSFFDTTQGNIEDKRMIPVNLPCREHLDNREDFPFRGNMDIEELEKLLSCERERIPLVYLTITNNTGGGQPVSLENIKKIRELTRKFAVPFFFDACRFAENAWFIQRGEKEYSGKSIKWIVHEMFRYVDGFHISLKKDGLVNMGGALVIRKEGDFKRRFPDFSCDLIDHQIMTEGHPTYGGLSGRDLMAVSRGLETITRQDYLDARIGQVEKFGEKLVEGGIPIIRPTGGHAVYIDMDRFFDGEKNKADFMGISFTALLLIGGHRVCELGTYAFGSYNGKREIPPDPRINYVRAAVPRLAYEDQDLFSVVEAIKVLADHREMIPGVNVEYGREMSLRHFKSRFSFLPLAKGAKSRKNKVLR